MPGRPIACRPNCAGGGLPPPAGCGIVAATSNKGIREEVMRRWQLTSVLLVLALPATAVAQDYPNRPIRAIASQGPGGLSDVFMRALADELGSALGTTVVVENRTGAMGSIGARACADSTPDGYTICILNAESQVINPLILKNMPLDPKRDLVPITRVFYLQQVFAVNADLKIKTFDQLAAHTKAHPKTMVYMAPSLSKVAFMEYYNKTQGTDFVRVPFKGGGDAVNSMLGGTTPVAIFGIGNLIQYIRAGKIVGLAVDGDKRSPLSPDIPTFREVGFTVHLWAASFGIHAPAGTPKQIVDRINKEIVKIGSNPEFQKRHLLSRGLAPVFDPPEEFAKKLDEERLVGAEIVKGSGLYNDLKLH
jgi:tripartite-type tricarboxylate transporter receptor subunit TctC